ncbi:MAG: hypothetical protein KIT20_00215 [Alphaproteobacteria bacterium]|nr:hypothetical protein [Alphaproteobacteria bacterium]
MNQKLNHVSLRKDKGGARRQVRERRGNADQVLAMAVAAAAPQAFAFSKLRWLEIREVPLLTP